MKCNQDKKKRAIKNVKPSNVEVVMLEHFQSTIPKGNTRKRLRRKERINCVQFNRSMTALEVQNSIMKAFKHLPVKNYDVLEADSTGHFLNRSATQYMNGQKIVSRRGSVYLCEVKYWHR